MALELVELKDVPNHDILNAIRNEGTMEYQQRIPEATKANVQDTLENLSRYRPQMNQFISAFVNQIGLIMAQNISWSNPLKEFKKGLLTHGDTIEDYMVDLVEAHTYSHDKLYMEKDLFGQHVPRVKTNFHRINREEFYPVTVKESVLRRAFLNDTGLSGLSAQIMQAPMESDQWDEFLVMVNLFKEYEANGGFFKVQVPDLNVLTSTDAQAKTVLRVMRAFIDTLSFRSRKYNAAAMSTHAKPEDLVIFCTPQFRAAVDVDALAGAFNLDKSNLNARIIAIPAEHFGIPGAQAIMTTRNFFIVGDTLWQTTSQENAVGLTHNFYLHHHQIVSASTFVPAVLFTTEPGDEIISIAPAVTGIVPVAAYDRNDVSVTVVERGEIYTLTSRGVTTGPNDGVRWELTGNQSPNTYVTQQGQLHVGDNDPSVSLTVKAITTGGAVFTDDLVLTVTGDAPDTFDGVEEPAEV
jgi:hypothetical protein